VCGTIEGEAEEFFKRKNFEKTFLLHHFFISFPFFISFLKFFQVLQFFHRLHLKDVWETSCATAEPVQQAQNRQHEISSTWSVHPNIFHLFPTQFMHLLIFAK